MTQSDKPQNKDPIELLELLLNKPNAPKKLPTDAGYSPAFVNIYETVVAIKDALYQMSSGNWSFSFSAKGVLAGYIKALQSNLNHMSWKFRQVADGDMKHRIEFMGDISSSFNNMVEKLIMQHDMLEAKQRELATLTQELQQEIRKKEAVEEALRVSEEMYRQRSLRDPLTGLYNRNYFFETASRELENLRRHPNDTACIIMLDIDHFKKVNDTYGHLAGDAILKTVSETINKILRKSDILARYGGEEFIVLLPNTDILTGLAIAERMRLVVADMPTESMCNGMKIHISLGVTDITDEDLHANKGKPRDKAIKKAVEEADTALYEAKRTGRNKVCQYNPATALVNRK